MSSSTCISLEKESTSVFDHSFFEELSEPPLDDMTPLQYFSKYYNDILFIMTLLDIVAEQTNIYSFQTIHKSIDRNCSEIVSLIGMIIKMGILQPRSYKLHWSRDFFCPIIADVMPRNRYQELLRYLLFAKNDSINAQDRLVEIRPLISL